MQRSLLAAVSLLQARKSGAGLDLSLNQRQDANVPELKHDKVTLVVGDLAKWQALGGAMPEITGMVFADIRLLTRGFLERVNPGLVLSPLTTTSLDALEIARRLRELGYRGRYRVVGRNLPDTGVIRAEIADAVPDLDIAVVDVSPAPPRWPL